MCVSFVFVNIAVLKVMLTISASQIMLLVLCYFA